MSSFSSEERMRFPAAIWAGRMAGLVALTGGVVAGGVLAGVSPGRAADHGFPYDSTLLLETKPMKGSKRVPILQIESKSAASIDLWCNTVPAQLVVADNTITIIMGSPTEKQCDPDRMQADQDLLAALQQVVGWRRQDDLLVLQGERSLRFHLSSN
jgi:heat shock protein HslJ